ncbi:MULTISPECIES: hypothetical protein [Bradyrhizobium]|uniref:hypothetical protein n=1 Tax=Bradyrhizobium TaxID=374 RepID=UPI00155EE01F|nr:MULTISPECIES: hypothetical protein [Bradyrhizobium]
MKLRFLITLFMLAEITSPCIASAEKADFPTIGYLGFDSGDKSKELLAAFRDGLRTKGFIEGQNVAIEYRFAEGKYIGFPS